MQKHREHVAENHDPQAADLDQDQDDHLPGEREVVPRAIDGQPGEARRAGGREQAIDHVLTPLVWVLACKDRTRCGRERERKPPTRITAAKFITTRLAG